MIYCNISECKNWLPLPEVHLMKNKPGFKPIGKWPNLFSDYEMEIIDDIPCYTTEHTKV